MSVKKGRRRTKRREHPEKTTMRAVITGTESEALKDYLRNWCGGMTIDETLRQALDLWLERHSHTRLATVTAKYSERKTANGKFVQGELF